MDTATILKKARDYIAVEKNDVFRAQVEDLVARNVTDELYDRFYTDLEFGTGGMRGVIGGGLNRMNAYVVQRATQGLATYVKKASGGAPASAVIAYDSRNYSDVFALEAAKVLAGNGITTFLFTSLRPTPELSFAVRHFSATTGIVITASHNPPAYNGYKVYWKDGGQIVPPHDKGIITEVRNVASISALSRDEAVGRGLLRMIDTEVDDAFIAMIKRQSLRPQLVKERGPSFTVVYTPLNGTGAMPVGRALSELGIKVRFVEEQRNPDGNFPTLKVPNPEEAAALKMGIDLARREQASLVLATDPDADRLGIAARHGGEFVLVTGNQLGTLLLDYILTSRKESGSIPPNGAFVKTIVTTELQRRVAESYGLRCFDVLTGFKYIAEKIAQFESSPGGPQYLFGGEESYGYLVETEVRDKDAVSAAVMTAEMALYHQSRGKTLIDRLDEIYAQYGYFQELLVSRYFEGASGLETMRALMDRLRTSPPATFAGRAVVAVKDYRDGTTRGASGVKERNIELPSSNVLQFVLDDETIVTARPSGTEPKIKFYASCCASRGTDLAAARADVKARIAAVSAGIDSLLNSGPAKG